jgi:hypothetical protein
MMQNYSCPRCGAMVSYGQNACAYCGQVFHTGGTGVPPYGQYNPNQPPPYNPPPPYIQPPPYNQYPAGGNPQQYHQQYPPRTYAPMPEKKSSSGLVVFLIVGVLCIAGAIYFMMNSNSLTKSLAAMLGQSATPASAPATPAPPSSTPPAAAKPPAAGSAASPAAVTENQGPLPTVTSFTATPASVNSGQSVTLQWDVSGAASASINGVGSVNAKSGTQAVNPTETTVYTITATSKAGSVYSSKTVTVSAPASSSGQSGQSSAPWQTWGKTAGPSGGTVSPDSITPENWGGKSAK